MQQSVGTSTRLHGIVERLSYRVAASAVPPNSPNNTTSSTFGDMRNLTSLDEWRDEMCQKMRSCLLLLFDWSFKTAS